MYRSEAATPEKWQDPGVNNNSHAPNNQSSAGPEQQSTHSTAAPGPPTTMMSRRFSKPREFGRGQSLIEEGQGDDWDHLPEQEQQQQQQQQQQQERQQMELTDDERLAKSSVAQTLVFSLLENTGAHGIPNIKRAPNIFRKILWTVLFLMGVAMFTWQTSWLFTRYYSYGVDTKLDISNDRMVEFPAVTICNLNPIKSDFFEDLIEQGLPLPPSLSGPPRRYGEDDDDEEFDDRFEMLGDAVELVAAYKYNERRVTGHMLRDMLLRCAFQGKHCQAKDFFFFHHYLYGNCYIFNAGPEPNTTTPRYFITKPGPLYGLTLELYIEQDQYIEDVQSSAGARVVVHARHDTPFPDDEGVSVSPGQETFIGFTRTNYTRLPYPYSNCTVVNNSKPTIFNLPLPHVRYTQRACENDCYYQNLTKQCGCADVRFRYDDNVLLCLNKTEVNCMDGVEMMYLAGKLECKCTPSCRHLEYNVVTGQARWPNEKYKPFLQDSIGNFSNDLEQDRDQDSDPNFLEKNVLKLNIYYDKLEYRTIYQDEAYDGRSQVHHKSLQVPVNPCKSITSPPVPIQITSYSNEL